MLNLPVSKNCSAIQTWLPLAFCLLAFWPARPYAQSVGIGTATPHASAQLEVASTNKGVLVPSVSLGNVFTASPVTSPATGLLVWNTNVAIANGQGAGFYYWTGARWVKLTTGNDGWHLGGNQVDTSFHFIGTLNNAGLMFRVANQKAGGIHPTGGNTFLGLEAGNLVRYSAQDFSGEHNTLLGAAAGSKLVDGRMNTFIGSRAGLNTQGSFGNTFMGYQSGATVGTGQENTALGLGAGNSTSGSRNVSIGVSAGGSLQNGFENIMIGYDVGSFLFDGANAPAYGNVWIGSNAATGNFGINPKLQSINNVIIGDSAARLVNGAIANVFVGKRSGMNSISGRVNVFVGDSSGLNNTTG
ncbi:MAG TPA: hypothetical protein PKD90_16805, partial [Phnomibacter sp.]|nr:hypothetical protein [Phnomibacter sp.]